MSGALYDERLYRLVSKWASAGRKAASTRLSRGRPAARLL